MMQRRPILKWPCAAVLSLTLLGCSQNYEALTLGKASAVPSVPSFGAGPYAYRFTLVHPETGKPWPNQPFRLFSKRHDLPSRQPSPAVYHGVTDAAGMTPIFRMRQMIDDAGWDITERVGEGAFGTSFTLKRAGRRAAPLPGYRYAMVLCSDPAIVYIGTSNARGNTAYLASDNVANVILLTGGDASDTDTAVAAACGMPK
jgi:hypothetical protein